MEVVGTYPGAERAERAERHGADQGRGDEVSHLRPPPGRTSLTPGWSTRTPQGQGHIFKATSFLISSF